MPLSIYANAFTFQSTPPVKAATEALQFNCVGLLISIHAAREGGDFSGKLNSDFLFISIHAAREGGDTPAASAKAPEDISIHAAREGGDVS